MALKKTETTPDDTTQVDTTTVMKGQIKFGREGVGNPTPTILARVTAFSRYVFTGLVVAVNSAPEDLFNAAESSKISWWLGVAILITGGVDYLTGVKSEKN